MQQKAFTLHNRGMNRDLSISKAGESAAYENHNIRIIARDNDTMLSVTNERGNKEISLPSIEGTLIGWNVLNNHILLFTTDGSFDYIYRIDYKNNEFRITYGGEEGTVDGLPIYKGHLGFNAKNPIESIVYHETEDIQKIYWIDGIHPLRFMNFAADATEVQSWDDGDATHFDSNRPINFTVSAEITKDNSGNNRANGVTQYLLTYFNKHGQETGIAWVSDLVYLSPISHGGSADGTNSNKVTLTFSDLDTRFSNFRIYSVFRSSYNGTVTAYIIGEGDTGDGAVIIDDGAHLVSEDASRLLYLGSQPLVAGTMAHKDQTLFLGDLQSTGQDYTELESAIRSSMFDNLSSGISSAITFEYSDDSDPAISSIPYNDTDGTYSYSSQLVHSSSEILTFKGGEKYRFALCFQTDSGVRTKAFWIGDAENPLYPVIDVNGKVIRRVVARCAIPQDVITAIGKLENVILSTVQLMIAEATYADRSVKAQGIINPTMFNVWERYNSRLYSIPSWISRPRRSNFACNHFYPVDNSTLSSGEIQCNYWETSGDPTPYYRMSGGKIVDELDGIADYDNIMILYGYQLKKKKSGSNNDIYYMEAVIVKSTGSVPTYNFTDSDVNNILNSPDGTYAISGTSITTVKSYRSHGNYKEEWVKISQFLQNYGVADTNLIISESDVSDLFKSGNSTRRWTAQGNLSTYNTSLKSLLNNQSNWHSITDETKTSADSYIASYYKKHLMFVDENIVTLNSPEFEYEAVTIDDPDGNGGYKLRIVGVAKITGSYSDYTVDATHGKASGENLVSASFSATADAGNIDGLTAWPLWKEFGLTKADKDADDVDLRDRTSGYYKYNSDLHKYWLYTWNHLGKIDGYINTDEEDYSTLKSKTFATMRFSAYTMYNGLASTLTYTLDSVRMFNALSSRYTGINVGLDTKYYDGNPEMAVGMPGVHKYPLLYSAGSADTNDVISADPDSNAHLFINEPVSVEFLSSAHSVLTLKSVNSRGVYNQTILPYISYDDTASIDAGAIIPWTETRYSISQSAFVPSFDALASRLESTDSYLFIGELYYDFSASGVEDTRYGGVSDSAVENCTFIPAGPSYSIGDMTNSGTIYANQGDTYFQRWDCLKTKPVGSSTQNGVIDVTSVMLETHINLDGRTDNLRGTKYLASIPVEEYGKINPVYTQTNNYFKQRDLGEDSNIDTYRSSITWTLDKQDSADIDEWTHIVLANSLKLDGDKGTCRALRRFNNSIISFQDRGISEVLFNSRTQLSTTDGVPVEIANSGKVDGKRYITNKFGCTNKWSIVEGKASLYFVDNINKAFCSFNGQGIQSLSSRLGFDAWFRRSNEIKYWTPENFENIVSYYDRIYSDVYLVTNNAEDQMPCLVYNETLGTFTSFFDYASVPMMANVEDRFISFRDKKLWLQNEGLYCNFFGLQYDFWVNYRVTPDPFGDKIWANIDYRADYYRVLDDSGTAIVPESMMINGEFYDQMAGTYQDAETFDTLRIWNEYQNTGEINLGKEYTTDRTTRRKFRIWHVAIPRAQRSDRNRWGLDRIRNPWINLLFKKKASDSANKDLMQLHDITVRYFE